MTSELSSVSEQATPAPSWQRSTEQLVSELACPACRGALSVRPGALRCVPCGKQYPVDKGVVRFIESDAFYEGTYQGKVQFLPDGRWRSELALHFINTHHLSWVRRWIRPGSSLLELGSGSGIRFVAHHARATALDLSYQSLLGIDWAYHLAVQADALALPFPDASYDAVTAVYFWEHISPDKKPQLLGELRRVLRPGGRIVFLFDVASRNPLFKWLRRSPELFEKCFVEHDHHYGLEAASENVRHFESNGFRVLDKHLANKTPVQHAPVYEWARPYGHPLTEALADAAKVVTSRPILNRLYGAGVTLFDDIVEPVFPEDWARLMLVALERRS